MALNYDFDMVPGTPGLFADIALTGTPQITARFRDPQTVAALKRAPQPMQDYLHASCFGSDTHHSGAPAGRYPLADEAARIAVIEALAENVARFDLPRPNDTQPVDDDFHLPTFFAAVAEAEPVEMEICQVPEPEAITAEPQTALPVADRFIADFIAAEDMSTAALIADTVATYGEKVDALIAAAVVADAPATDDSVAEANAMPAAFRFRLPTLPRWLTAGAALTVLGVAVGTSMI